MKTRFKKLILFIPLRSEIAAVFAVILGSLGVFIPLVYLFITVQDTRDVITYLVVSRTDLFQVIDVFSCGIHISGVELPPYWLTNSNWYSLLRAFPVMIGMHYFNIYGSKKSKNMAFALLLLGLVSIIYLDNSFTPTSLTCSEGWRVTIYAYSISWLSILAPMISLLLGIYAIQKRRITMIETQ